MESEETAKVQQSANQFFATVHALIDSVEMLRIPISAISNEEEKALVCESYDKVRNDLQEMAIAADRFFDDLGAEPARES